ncbi:MAG: foldase [Clostridiaceae bacterium]|nr:foldase [Clostridiaceae bacterium]
MENNFFRSKVALFVTILIVAAAVLIVALSLNNGEVVAKIGEEEISKDQFYDRLVEMYGSQVLDSMITEKIVELEAKKAKISVTDKDVQKELDKMIEQVGGEEMFNFQLAYSGYTMDQMKEELKNYLTIVKILEPKIEITDEEINSYFEENKDRFAQEEEVQASHILVDDEETANKVKKLLDDGGDFAALAKEYSKDGSAQSGGDLGYFTKGEMVQEFEDAAFSMEIGQVSEPVKSEYGYHIIKVTDKKEAQEATLENSKDEIKDILRNQKVNELYPTWITEMQEQYDIKNNLK